MTTSTPSSLNTRFTGCLLGTAVGDALGLPAENLSRRRIEKWYRGKWKHRFIGRMGMVSDDTEHTFLVARSLLEYPDDPDHFQEVLARRIKWWFAALPAGVGLATARACFKLWMGFHPSKSGVFSAGNGPAMRSAIIGAFFHNQPDKLEEYTKRSTRITHRDPKATTGALAVARLTAWSIPHPQITEEIAQDAITLFESCGDDPEWLNISGTLRESWNRKDSVSAFADRLGLANGITGYIYHTVPVAVYAWLLHYNDFRATLEFVLNLGGDTDTVGAIAGAMAGTVTGDQNIPTEWLTGIHDWPLSTRLLRKTADALADRANGHDASLRLYPWPFTPLRNLAFLLIVLLHGLRRLLPPYG